MPLDFEKHIDELEYKIEELQKFSSESGLDLSGEITKLENKIIKLKEETFHNLSPWQKVSIVRLFERPTSLDYIDRIFENFMEFHGDRLFGDDGAIVGGIAKFNGIPVTIIGQQRGRDVKENVKRNFGMPHPEGYRKSMRLAKQAEKFGRPIICFVDTKGASPGIGAEERGQGEAIAKSLMLYSNLKVPVITIVIGEAGSGGALAMAVANKIYMLEHAIYQILSPEGFATIIWKDASRAPEASELMKLTAQDLQKFGVIDGIITEPLGGAHRNPDQMASEIKKAIEKELPELMKLSGEQLAEDRYSKFRMMGQFLER